MGLYDYLKKKFAPEEEEELAQDVGPTDDPWRNLSHTNVDPRLAPYYEQGLSEEEIAPLKQRLEETGRTVEGGAAVDAAKGLKTAEEQLPDVQVDVGEIERLPDEETAADAARGLRPAGGPKVSLEMGPLQIEPHQAAKRASVAPQPSMADAFKKNELLRAIDRVGVKPEESEVPQNTSDQPEAQVDKAAQRPRAVQNRAAYYAALKDIATSFKGFAPLQGAGSGSSFYDAKIAEEGQKQKDYQGEVADWRRRVAEDLKQKFEAGENAKKLGEQNRASKAREEQNRLNSENLRQYREDNLGQKEDQFGRAEAGRESRSKRSVHSANERARLSRETTRDIFGDRSVGALESHLPPQQTIDRADRVLARLKDPKPLPGFGAMQNAIRKGKGLFGQGASAAIMADMSPEEQKDFTDLWGLGSESFFEQGGKNLTEEEVKQMEAAIGRAPGQGDASSRQALFNVAKGIKDKVSRKAGALGPDAQRKAIQRGVIRQTDLPWMLADDDEFEAE